MASHWRVYSPLLKSLSSMPPVTQDDNTLIAAYNAGHEPSGHALFVKHHKLILKIIFDITRGSFFSDDLLSAGALGLCMACRRFDSSVGVAFSTYAYYWCYKYIILEASNDILPAGGIMFGRGLKDRLFKYIGLRMTGYTPDAIAEKMRITLEEVAHLAVVASQASRPISISTETDSDNPDTDCFELYGIPSAPAAEDVVLSKFEDDEYTKYVEELISKIPSANERFILNHTLGLNGAAPYTRSELLKELKLSAKQLADTRKVAYNNLRKLIRPQYSENPENPAKAHSETPSCES